MTPTPALQPLTAGPLSSRVLDTLRTAIFDGRLLPGTPLRELHLARDLRVSQATVRQALLQLEQLGLVVRTPNIGTHVTRMSPQEVRERVELRLVLEERALVAAAPRMTPDDFAELDGRLADLSEATARNAYFDQARADLEFHRCIWRHADNRTLYRTLDQLAVPLFAFVSILRGSNRQTLADVVQSHEGIVRALRDGDAAGIHDTLRDHLISGFSLPDE
jgi:DNA-binding GntR family transcriptional regulator